MQREKKNHCRLQSRRLPVCKWTHPFRSFTHHLRRRWREGIRIKRSAKSKSPPSTSCCLRCSIPTWQGAMPVGLGTGEASLYLPISFSLYSFSLSQLCLNWGQGPLGLALLCHRKIANPGSTLIEHWKQEFYKEADLLFITSHSLLFFLPLSPVFFFFFRWFTVPHSSFFSWTFLKLSLCCVHSLPLCCNPLPSRGLPWWGEDIMRLSSFSQCYVGDSNVTANTVIIARFTEGLAFTRLHYQAAAGVCKTGLRVLQEWCANNPNEKFKSAKKSQQKVLLLKFQVTVDEKVKIWLPKWGPTAAINHPHENWIKVYHLCDKIQSRMYKLFTTYPITTWHTRSNVS